MPRRYKQKRVRRVRRGKLRKPKFAMTRQVQNTFSDRQIVKLNYFDQILMDPGSLGAAGYAFRANCCFDPDYSSTGHQPMGFDQWGAFYQKFVVLGAKITVNPLSSDATSDGSSAIITCALQRTPIQDININQQIEQKHSRYSTVQLGFRSRPIVVHYSAKKFEGVKDVSDNDDLFGTLSASPNKQSYFVISGYASQPSSDTKPIRLQVKINYIVMFKDPQRLPIS